MVGVVFWGIISYWGAPYSCQIGVVLVDLGSLWGGYKCGKVYGVETKQGVGCRALNNFFKKLGVTTEISHGDTNASRVHRGDTNVSGCTEVTPISLGCTGVTPMSPGCTGVTPMSPG